MATNGRFPTEIPTAMANNGRFPAKPTVTAAPASTAYPPGTGVADINAPVYDVAPPSETSPGLLKTASNQQSLSSLQVSAPETTKATAPTDIPTAMADAGTAQTPKVEVNKSQLADAELNRITAQDSPLMKQAQHQGILSAAKRGLQNSSLAAGAAQAEVVKAASPLAQQNAQIYADQAQANQSAETDVNKLNAQLQTAVSQGNAEQANAISTQIAQLQAAASSQNATADNAMKQTVLQSNAELNKQYLAGTQAMDLATIQGEYNTLISTNETAASLYNAYFNSIAISMQNENSSPEKIAADIQVQQAMLQSGLDLISKMTGLQTGK